MITQLRNYQRKAIEDTYSWMAANRGNPCIVAPTGSGKSWIIAGLCEDIMHRWPTSRILILSHVKELLVQDAEKILAAWPKAPLGIYSAGLDSREFNIITVAGIQSLYKRVKDLERAVERIDLVIVDEAHLINMEEKGMYRSLLARLNTINPAMRIIGLTATPYRLGQGLLTQMETGDDDIPIFSALIESISIDDLVEQGYLAPLSFKFTDITLDVDGVKKRNGEFISSELEEVIDTEKNNRLIVSETIRRAGDRRAWLVFCAGIDHAFHMRDEFRRQGVNAETVTGDTPPEERQDLLERFKTGKIKALTNMNVLTTGFDYPDIDVLVMARPTLSPGLYCQMAGRGMRVKSGAYKDCLVLDFAGNIILHGPITAVKPPKKRGPRDIIGMKKCPNCDEAVIGSLAMCPSCGYVFPLKKEPEEELKEEKEPQERKWKVPFNEVKDMMMSGIPDGGICDVTIRGWSWYVVKSRSKDIPMIRVDFQPMNIGDRPYPLYLCLMHGGYAEEKAKQQLRYLMHNSCAWDWDLTEINSEMDLKVIAADMNDNAIAPKSIRVKRDGQYWKMLHYVWKQDGERNGTAA